MWLLNWHNVKRKCTQCVDTYSSIILHYITIAHTAIFRLPFITWLWRLSCISGFFQTILLSWSPVCSISRSFVCPPESSDLSALIKYLTHLYYFPDYPSFLRLLRLYSRVSMCIYNSCTTSVAGMLVGDQYTNAGFWFVLVCYYQAGIFTTDGNWMQDKRTSAYQVKQPGKQKSVSSDLNSNLLILNKIPFVLW